MKPNVAILTGFGLNCERETAFVFEKAGANIEYVHINDIILGAKKLSDYQILAFIGGFAFGDHIASGRVLAIKFKYKLYDQLMEYISKDNLIIGICNGSQTLVKLGILPGNPEFKHQQVASLTHNDNPGYRDDWVMLKANKNSPCVFTKDIDYIEVPIRHGEGKFVCNENVLSTLKANNQVVFQYVHPISLEPTMDFPYNPNGSIDAIAGICSPDGRIFGLMPHPEAFHTNYNHPLWYVGKKDIFSSGMGMKIFENAIKYFV